MTRLPPITNANLTRDQQAIWKGVTSGKRGPSNHLITVDGGLAGPFNAALHAPSSGRHITELGETIRFGSDIEPRLLELAICTVGAHWRSNFEWFVHRPLAEQAGVNQSVMDAIERGDEPTFDHPDEAAVYAITRSLLMTGRVSDAIYADVHHFAGDGGVVEITQAVGFYCLISFTLNAFEVELPPGNVPTWPY